MIYVLQNSMETYNILPNYVFELQTDWENK